MCSFSGNYSGAKENFHLIIPVCVDSGRGDGGSGVAVGAVVMRHGNRRRSHDSHSTDSIDPRRETKVDDRGTPKHLRYATNSLKLVNIFSRITMTFELEFYNLISEVWLIMVSIRTFYI